MTEFEYLRELADQNALMLVEEKSKRLAAEAKIELLRQELKDSKRFLVETVKMLEMLHFYIPPEIREAVKGGEG